MTALANHTDYDLGSDVTTDVMDDVINDLSAESLRLFDLILLISQITDIYFNAVITIVGCVSNVIAAFVLWPRAKKTSAFNYLFFIAVLDTCYVFVNGLSTFLFARYGINLVLLTHCSVFTMLVFPISHLSSWALALCCIERCLVIYYPLKAKVWFTTGRARIAIVVTTVGVLLGNWYIFGGIDNVKEGSHVISLVGDSCLGRNDELKFYHKYIVPWVDLSLYSFLPGVILLVTNIAISVKLCRIDNDFGPGTISNASEKIKSQKSRKITAMALSLALIFIVTTTPLTVVWSLFHMAITSGGIEKLSTLKLAIALPLTITLSLLNHCVNLFMYMIFSKDIRHDVKNVFTCGYSGKKQTNNTTTKYSVETEIPNTNM